MTRKLFTLLLAALLTLGLTFALAEGGVLTVTDMFDREIVIPDVVTRIVVTEPADCEILCALGGEELIVARGLYCDYPASVLALPAVQSGANTNLEEILALAPQVVIMSDMAHAVEQVTMLEQCGIPVVCTNADSIPGVYEAIRLLGQIVGKDAEAEAMIADMQAAFSDVAARSTPSDMTIYFEVMPLEWGLWSAGAGTFMDEMAGLCGMQNAFADLDGWQPISQEQVIGRNPDFIVLVTGMGDGAVEEVLSRAGWSDIDAVRNGRVYNADSYAMTRPGPRLKDAIIDLFAFLSNTAPAETSAD